jgi:hypothetical protein
MATGDPLKANASMKTDYNLAHLIDKVRSVATYAHPNTNMQIQI